VLVPLPVPAPPAPVVAPPLVELEPAVPPLVLEAPVALVELEPAFPPAVVELLESSPPQDTHANGATRSTMQTLLIR
jgi:hypothetical protein